MRNSIAMKVRMKDIEKVTTPDIIKILKSAVSDINARNATDITVMASANNEDATLALNNIVLGLGQDNRNYNQ